MKRNFLRILSVGIMSTAAWQAQGAAADHLVLSEIGKNAAVNSEGEYIEIFNPTPNPISLNDYWLSDLRAHYNIVNTDPIAITTNDNIVRFPAGFTLNSG